MHSFVRSLKSFPHPPLLHIQQANRRRAWTANNLSPSNPVPTSGSFRPPSTLDVTDKFISYLASLTYDSSLRLRLRWANAFGFDSVDNHQTRRKLESRIQRSMDAMWSVGFATLHQSNLVSDPKMMKRIETLQAQVKTISENSVSGSEGYCSPFVEEMLQLMQLANLAETNAKVALPAAKPKRKRREISAVTKGLVEEYLVREGFSKTLQTLRRRPHPCETTEADALVMEQEPTANVGPDDRSTMDVDEPTASLNNHTATNSTSDSAVPSPSLLTSSEIALLELHKTREYIRTLILCHHPIHALAVLQRWLAVHGAPPDEGFDPDVLGQLMGCCLVGMMMDSVDGAEQETENATKGSERSSEGGFVLVTPGSTTTTTTASPHPLKRKASWSGGYSLPKSPRRQTARPVSSPSHPTPSSAPPTPALAPSPPLPPASIQATGAAKPLKPLGTRSLNPQLPSLTASLLPFASASPTIPGILAFARYIEANLPPSVHTILLPPLLSFLIYIPFSSTTTTTPIASHVSSSVIEPYGSRSGRRRIAQAVLDEMNRLQAGPKAVVGIDRLSLNSALEETVRHAVALRTMAAETNIAESAFVELEAVWPTR